jgi:hypothetical protein
MGRSRTGRCLSGVACAALLLASSVIALTGANLCAPAATLAKQPTTSAAGMLTPATFVITPAVDGGHGSVTPASPQSVGAGATPTFTFAPNAGYVVFKVLVDGAAVIPTTATTYTFAPVTTDHTLTVSFAPALGGLTTEAPFPATVRRGHVAVLRYAASQAILNGRVDVKIRISDAGSKTVKTLTRRNVTLDELHKARFLCLLKRGAYTFTVSARHSSEEQWVGDGSNKLTVR